MTQQIMLILVGLPWCMRVNVMEIEKMFVTFEAFFMAHASNEVKKNN